MKTFSEKVVELAIRIPKGKITTYGKLASRAGGGSMSSRSVTHILEKAYMAGEKKYSLASHCLCRRESMDR